MTHKLACDMVRGTAFRLGFFAKLTDRDRVADKPYRKELARRLNALRKWTKAKENRHFVIWSKDIAQEYFWGKRITPRHQVG